MTLRRRLFDQIRLGWQHPRLLNRLLYPLSVIYACLMWVRRFFYRVGVLRRHKLPVPVVVVGNLSVGGTGKTPLVIALTNHLKTRGKKPGVITRGYGGRSDARSRVIVVDENGNASAQELGDEPLLIARRCRVPVMVDAERVRAARRLVAAGCDLIISDDGFQHHALARDLDIVVVDGARRFGNGWCLPAGALREPPGNLARADIVVVHNGDVAGDEYAMTTHINDAIKLGDSARDAKTRPLKAFADAPIHAIAGVGNPSRFFQQLRAQGLTITAHEFPDHHQFSAADFAFATDRAAILMTEKDAVKCEAVMRQSECAANAEQCWVVPLQVEVGGGLLAAVEEVALAR